MKRIVLIFTVLLTFNLSFAQEQTENKPDKQTCGQWLSIEHEFIKAKNYKDAEEYWVKLHTQCPGYHKVIYSDGVRLYSNKYKKETDEAKKKAYARKIISLYDEKMKYFSDPTGQTSEYKAIAMLNYKVGTQDEIYAILDKVFKEHPENFTHPKAFWGYFNAIVSKYKKGEIPLEEVFNRYDDITELLRKNMDRLSKEYEALMAKDESALTPKELFQKNKLAANLPAMNQVYKIMDRTLGKLGDCNTLVPFYSKRFDAHKTDAKWLKRAASRLNAKKCQGPLFVKIVEALNKIEPSATSTRFLAIKFKQSKKYGKALEYFKKALGLETDPYKKAEIAYSIALLYDKTGNKSMARQYALKAVQYKPSFGKPYLLIASMYARSANACGNTTFEKTAIYWKAEELARKAAQVDPTIRKSALRAAQSYRDRAPSKQEVFIKGMGGKVIKFDKCWVGGSVRVPTN